MEKNHDPLSVARSYVEANRDRFGLAPFDETPSTLVPDPERSRLTAAVFDRLKHDPKNPGVKKVYDALKTEVHAQFDHMIRSGVSVTPWRTDGQPYSNSDEMRKDVRDNAHLFYFPTDSGFGEGDQFADHPLYEVAPNGLRYNDMFRAVHDYFAHAVHPHQFGPRGEYRAWHEHAKMFSRLARLAMSTETHGQNSWVNFGPHSTLPVKDRPYADQKAAVLPVSHHPVKLSRPGGLFSRFKALFQSPPRERHAHDGIVHEATDAKGRFNTDGFVKAIAERSAVAGALQKLGYRQTDPTKHQERVRLFVDAAAALHRLNPEGLRLVLDHYRKAAGGLNVPDVVKPDQDKTPLGEWPEPPKNTYYTVPNVGPAGQDMIDATVPLVRVVDRILEKVRPGHVALDRAKDDPIPKPAPDPVLKVDHNVVDTAAAIPAGHGDKFRIGLADMRKFRPKAAPAPAAVPDEEKIPLVNYPGEVGPTGDRWALIHRLHEAGHDRQHIVKKVAERFSLSPRNAAATYARYLRQAAKVAGSPPKGGKGPRIKFSRGWYGGITKGGGFDKEYGQEWRETLAAQKGPKTTRDLRAQRALLRGATMGVLADAFDDHDDPRGPHVRGAVPFEDATAAAKKFVGNGKEMFADARHEAFRLPDGTELYVSSHRGPTGKQAHVVSWAGAGRAYTDDQLRAFVEGFPEEIEAAIKKHLNEGHVRGTRRIKLARAVAAKDITGPGVDKQIAGSRFAFHLRQIAEEFRKEDPLLSKMAMHALTLTGRHALKVREGGFNGDIYDRIARRLKWHAAPVADHIHKPMMKALRALSPDSGTDYELARTATAPEKRAVIEAAKKTGDGTVWPSTASEAVSQPDKVWDVFRTRAAARHFLDAYNWGRINDGLHIDKHVADFLAANLKGHTDEDDLHEKAHRSFDLTRGAALSKAPDWHAKFWDKLHRYVKEKTGSNFGRDRINGSLARLADRAVERRETAAGGKDWRTQFGWTGGAKHMKFNRPKGGVVCL